MRTPNLDRINDAVSAAEAYVLRPARRESIKTKVAQQDLPPHEVEFLQVQLADAVQTAARRWLVRQAVLADLPQAERKPSVAPDDDEAAEYLSIQREHLADTVRLAEKLAASLEIVSKVPSFVWALAGLAELPQGSSLPDNADAASWEALGAMSVSRAAETIARVAQAARLAAPVNLPKPPRGHIITEIVFAIEAKLEASLPFHSASIEQLGTSPAAPQGLLVALVGETISAIREAGGKISEVRDLRKTVKRILDARADWQDRLDKIAP